MVSSRPISAPSSPPQPRSAFLSLIRSTLLSLIRLLRARLTSICPALPRSAPPRHQSASPYLNLICLSSFKAISARSSHFGPIWSSTTHLSSFEPDLLDISKNSQVSPQLRSDLSRPRQTSPWPRFDLSRLHQVTPAKLMSCFCKKTHQLWTLQQAGLIPCPLKSQLYGLLVYKREVEYRKKTTAWSWLSNGSRSNKRELMS